MQEALCSSVLSSECACRNTQRIMEYTGDSEDINEWLQIEHPSPENSPTVHQSSGGWNTVVIRENYIQGDQSSSILHPTPTHHQASSSQIIPTVDPEDGTSPPPVPPPVPAASFLSDEEGANPMPPLPPPSDWRLRVASEGRKLLNQRFEAIRARMVRVASKVRDCAVCVGAFWSITYVTGAAAAAAAVVWLVYVGIQRRRRRVDRPSAEQLVYLVREKDEKISQLLLQIAQLNEVLSSRRKVPVLRISS